MHNRLFVVPLMALALACGDSGTGPDLSVGATGGTGGTGTPNAVSGDTSVSTTGFVSSSVVVAGTTYLFKVFVPANYNTSSSKFPVMVFMHGSGDQGSDNEAQLRTGLGPYVRARASTFPAIVVFPQSPRGQGLWPTYVQIVRAALDQVMTQYGKADPSRQYLNGYSYGFGIAFDVAYLQPTRFAAIVPMAGVVCGFCLTGSSSTTSEEGARLAAQALKSVAIWQFQGSADDIATPALVRPQVAEFRKAGGNYQYTEFPGVGHAIEDAVYNHAPMWTWLWAQKR